MIAISNQINFVEIILDIEGWLESQRVVGGYAGPVVHWWGDSLEFQEVGLDWRYEGIIFGYLNLWTLTADHLWLTKASQAGDDLIAGQLPSGNFRNSRFELNPGTCGTPHEAACDLALLHLSRSIRNLGDPRWRVYKNAAYQNINNFYIKHLWSPDEKIFFDNLGFPSFVPNKAATLTEALFELSRIESDDYWVQEYALPTLEGIIRYQVKSGRFKGAIYQNGTGNRRVGKYFPFYIARCVPALLEGYAWTNDPRYAECAVWAGDFIVRYQYDDGSFPQVIYTDNRINRYPQWIAGLGDILRVMDQLAPLGMEYERNPTIEFLLAGLKPDGGIRTATGFGKATPFGQINDPRDDLSVCGWVDKTFRYFSGLLVESFVG